MINRIIFDAADAFQWIVGIGGVLWLVQYTLYAKWWKNFIGRSIVLMLVTMLFVLGPSLATLVDPSLNFMGGYGYAYLETVGLAIGAYAIVSRIWGWERIRRARGFNGHRGKDDGEATHRDSGTPG